MSLYILLRTVKSLPSAAGIPFAARTWEIGPTMAGKEHPLRILYEEIDERAAAVAGHRPDWPCRKGCDQCCRSLAEAPALSRTEWREVERGLDLLEEGPRRQIEDRLGQVARIQGGPVLCPFLDLDLGACYIYAHRPAACRTYGFYRDRDGGRFCQIIEAKISQEGDGDIVWGNHEALERRLRREAGPPIPLRQWWLKR